MKFWYYSNSDTDFGCKIWYQQINIRAIETDIGSQIHIFYSYSFSGGTFKEVRHTSGRWWRSGVKTPGKIVAGVLTNPRVKARWFTGGLTVHRTVMDGKGKSSGGRPAVHGRLRTVRRFHFVPQTVCHRRKFECSFLNSKRGTLSIT